MVLLGVSSRYLFHTCRATSCHCACLDKFEADALLVCETAGEGVVLVVVVVLAFGVAGTAALLGGMLMINYCFNAPGVVVNSYYLPLASSNITSLPKWLDAE